jgi:hypothetical protein
MRRISVAAAEARFSAVLAQAEAGEYPFRGRDEPENHCNAMGLLAG